MHFLSLFSLWLQRVVIVAGYPGFSILLAAASLNIPISSEIVYAFAGFLSSRGTFSLPVVIILGGISTIIGSSANYWLGRKGRIAHNHSEKGLFLMNHKSMAGHKERFERWGEWAVFWGQLTPGVRGIIGFASGFFEIEYRDFLIFTSIASLIWAGIWTGLGYKLGSEWGKIGSFVHKLDLAALGLVILIVATWWFKNHKKH